MTFTATVSPSAATDAAQFYIDGSPVGSPVPLSGGKATLTTSSLSAGSHPVKAPYTATAIMPVVTPTP